MHDRFSFHETKTLRLPKLLIFVIIWAGIIVLFLFGTSQLAGYSSDKQYESLQQAITDDIAQCYAIEGFYPPDIDYLKNRYGLYYDEDRFYIDYRALGSNLYPDVTVIERRDQK